MDVLGQDSLPGYLKNLSTGEQKGFLLNPTELRTSIRATYKERELLGMPNVPLDYEKTENQEFTFTLLWSATHIQTQGKTTQARAIQEIKDWKAFLSSLLVPIETPHKNWKGGEPPKVWFYWPGEVSMRGRITRVAWTLRMFNLNLNSIYEVAQVTFKTDQEYPIWSDEVRLLGWEVRT